MTVLRALNRRIVTSIALAGLYLPSNTLATSTACHQFVAGLQRISKVASLSGAVVATACAVSGCTLNRAAEGSPPLKNLHPAFDPQNFQDRALNRYFYNEHASNLAHAINSDMKAKGKDYIFIVDFYPNDFGREARNKIARRDRSPHSEHRLEKLALVRQTELSDFEAAALHFNYHQDWALLGRISFRSEHDPIEALQSVKTVFGGLDSVQASKIYFVGLGGSHGSDGLRKFREAMKAEGYDLDFVILGDAIKQPLWLPMHSFFSDPTDRIPAIHFRQGQYPWLKGSAISGFLDIPVKFSQSDLSDNHAHAIAADLFDTGIFFDELIKGSGSLLSPNNYLSVEYLKLRIARDYPNIDRWLTHQDKGARIFAGLELARHQGDLDIVMNIYLADSAHYWNEFIPYLKKYPPRDLARILLEEFNQNGYTPWTHSDPSTLPSSAEMRGLHFLNALKILPPSELEHFPDSLLNEVKLSLLQ
jgi:hypothetical protein